MDSNTDVNAQNCGCRRRQMACPEPGSNREMPKGCHDNGNKMPGTWQSWNMPPSASYDNNAADWTQMGRPAAGPMICPQTGRPMSGSMDHSQMVQPAMGNMDRPQMVQPVQPMPANTTWPQTGSFMQGSQACPQTGAGPLEAQYPVAMAYVPWQQWQTTYAPERGLAQGTIFPELDLQFSYGRCSR